MSASGHIPETRYVRSNDAGIAYQVVGDGPLDLVMVPGFPSHLELGWQYPRLAYFYRRLASFSRLILLDKRGLGLSDRVPEHRLPGVEQRMEDLPPYSMRSDPGCGHLGRATLGEHPCPSLRSAHRSARESSLRTWKIWPSSEYPTIIDASAIQPPPVRSHACREWGRP